MTPNGTNIDRYANAGNHTARVVGVNSDGRHILLEFEDAEVPPTPEGTHRYLRGPAIDQILVDEQVTIPSTSWNIIWPLTDNLGTVRHLANYDDATGVTEIVNHITYDAFGHITDEQNLADPTADPVDHIFGFTGRERDEESDLNFYRARYYDPSTGQFISQDPIGFDAGDANLYRYVGNGPTNATDPSGLIEVDEAYVQRFLERKRSNRNLQRYVKARREQPNAYSDKLGWRDQIMQFFGGSNSIDQNGIFYDDYPDVEPTEEEIRAFISWCKDEKRVNDEAYASSMIPGPNMIGTVSGSLTAARSVRTLRGVTAVDTTVDYLQATQAARTTPQLKASSFVITTLDDGIANAATVQVRNGTSGVIQNGRGVGSLVQSIDAVLIEQGFAPRGTVRIANDAVGMPQRVYQSGARMADSQLLRVKTNIKSMQPFTEWRRTISRGDIGYERTKFLGIDAVKIEDGTWRSLDGSRQFRTVPGDYLGRHGIGKPLVPDTPHVHFEFLAPPNPGGTNLRVLKNVHVPLGN